MYPFRRYLECMIILEKLQGEEYDELYARLEPEMEECWQEMGENYRDLAYNVVSMMRFEHMTAIPVSEKP